MNSLLGYSWSNCFFFRQVFLLISHKARKAKWIEKRSVRSRPVKQIFLQYKITNCTHVVYTYIFFFLRGHGNESCNLIGSSPGHTHTLTLLKYFSSASHNIILSLSYDLASYTLFLLFLHFFYYFTFLQSTEFMFHTKPFSS